MSNKEKDKNNDISDNEYINENNNYSTDNKNFSKNSIKQTESINTKKSSVQFSSQKDDVSNQNDSENEEEEQSEISSSDAQSEKGRKKKLKKVIQVNEDQQNINLYPLFWKKTFGDDVNLHPPLYEEVGPPQFTDALVHPNVNFIIQNFDNFGDEEEEKVTQAREARKDYFQKIQEQKNQKELGYDSKTMIKNIQLYNKNIKNIRNQLEFFQKYIERSCFYFIKKDEDLFSGRELLIYQQLDENAQQEMRQAKVLQNLSKFEEDLDLFWIQQLDGKEYINLRDKIVLFLKEILKYIHQYNIID